MKISILSYGTRGDIQPYLALALALAEAGHQVRLAAPAMFAEMVEQYVPQNDPQRSVDFFPLPGDPTQLMRSAGSLSPLTMLLPGALRQGLTVVNFIGPVIPQLIRAAREAVEGADLVIHTLLTAVIGHQIARSLGVHDVSALVFPVFLPTGQFPNPLFSPWPDWIRIFGKHAAAYGPRYNYLTHREFNRVFWYGSRMTIHALRRGHPDIPLLEEWPFESCDGIAPICPAATAEIIYGISRHALPYPSDWTGRNKMMGYWFLDAPPDWHPPPGLERFLDSGSPPVFIGFGSVISKQANRLTQAAIDALRRTGQRGVLLQGWGGLKPEALPEWVYPVEQVPYDWLFPRITAAVHHGGMGTTAAVLRAGISQVVMPFTFDQPFWGRQVQHLGVGPAPITHGQRSAQSMADAIDKMLNDTGMRQSAAHLGETIRAENGLQNAVRAILQYSSNKKTQL